MRKKLLTTILICVMMVGLPGFSQCGSPSSDYTGYVDINSVVADIEDPASDPIPEEAEISAFLKYSHKLETEYASKFEVFYFEDGSVLLTTVDDGAKFLIVPEDGEIPTDLEEDVWVIKRPVKNIYLVASAVMDMFAELDAVDTIGFSGKKAEDWYIKEAKEAMNRGELVYAGKYSKPDYEMIVSGDCSFIIENTMIFHSPEVKEQFEKFGIPVMVEYSNYEDHPLGRVEWVKLYGALLGLEDEADEIFEEQKRIVESAESGKKTGKTVAYFYITSNNLIQTRKNTDYIPKMIEIAGGEYIYKDSKYDDDSLMVNMQIEQFYNDAKDADVIIYNSSVDGGVGSLDELFAKSELFKDFKAVKEGNVWCTTKDMYQETLSIGYMIEDMSKVFNGKEDGLNYLFKLE